jgi:hypothetical protein
MHVIHTIVGLGVLTASFAVNAQASFITLPTDNAQAASVLQKTVAADPAFAELSDSRSVLKLVLADGRHGRLPAPASTFESPAPRSSAHATDPATGIVPEPSTYATLLAGLALLTLVMNRRRD